MISAGQARAKPVPCADHAKAPSREYPAEAQGGHPMGLRELVTRRGVESRRVGREEGALTFAVVNHDPFPQISIHSVPVCFVLFFVCLSFVCLSVVLTFLFRIPAALVIPG